MRRSLKHLILIVSLLGILGLCSWSCCSSAPNSIRESLLNKATTTEEKGVFVVIHGLNNPPSILASLEDYLHSLGYSTLRVTLPGHDGLLCAPSRDAWIATTRKAFEQARKQTASGEINMLGFSTGAVVLMDSVLSDNSIHINKAIFLSPAIVPRWYAFLIKPILLLHYFNVPGFTLAPKGYTYYRFPPLKLYRALFDSIDSVNQASNLVDLQKIPTLVAIAEHDELVSLTGVKEWAQSRKLDAWKFIPIQPESTLPEHLDHLIVDEPSLGAHAWKELKENIRAFLT